MIDVDECDLQWRKFVHHENLIFYCFKFFETVSIVFLLRIVLGSFFEIDFGSSINLHELSARLRKK